MLYCQYITQMIPNSSDTKYKGKYGMYCHKLTNLCLESLYFLLMLVVNCLLKFPPNQLHLMCHQLQPLFQLPIPEAPCLDSSYKTGPIPLVKY